MSYIPQSKNGKKFIKNLFVTTLTTITISVLVTFFRIYEVNTIGTTAVGLMSLTMGVYFLSTNFAIYGINYAVTRLVSEKFAIESQPKNNHFFKTYPTIKIMKVTVFLALCFSLTTMVLLVSFSNIIATYWVKSSDVSIMIKILGYSLPFFAISCCFRSYFLAKKCSFIISIAQFIENGVNIAIVFLFLKKYAMLGVKEGLSLIAIGMAVGEVVSCIFIVLAYFISERKKTSKGSSPTVSKIFSISILIGTGGAIRSTLSMVENMLIPQGLIKSGLKSNEAIADYGTLKGMVMPIIFFPSTFLIAFSTLLIPEVAQLHALGKQIQLKRIVNKVLSFNIIFSVFVMFIFLTFSTEICTIFYPNNSSSSIASSYMVMLTPIIPFLYFDSIVDAMLKGMNEQGASLKINLLDTSLRIILIITLLPLLGMKGCLFITIASEIFNCTLSVLRLFKVTGYRPKIKLLVLKPLILSFFSFGFIRLINIFMPKSQNNIFYLLINIATAFLIYLILLKLFTKDSTTKKESNCN